MYSIIVGEFEIDVSEPYPCWVRLRHRGEEIAMFSHKNLSELKFAVGLAQREAMQKLGDHRLEAADPTAF